MSIAEIKEAIAKLSPQEYCELMAELHPYPDDDWDKQMKTDVASGKLDFIRPERREGATGRNLDPAGTHS